VRRVDAATGLITTVAGTGVFGYNGDGRLATTARLAQPNGLEVDASGNLFIVDTANQRIRRVDAATGLITTVAGTGELGYNGDRRPATEAKFYFPMSVAFDAAGNLFISDWGNNRVRRVDAATGLITTVAGTGVAGNNGSEGPATTTRLYGPQGIAFDAAGNLFITDSGNHRVRRVNAQTKRMTTVAGGSGGGPYDGDNKPATQARLWSPDDVAVDAAGNLFISDFGNNRIRRVSAQTGLITTVAGTGAYGYNGEGIAATAARLAQPTSVVLDAAGDLFIANLTLGNEYADDLGVSRVRRVDARSNLITTVAGTSEFASDGDEQLATAARMSPQGVAIDAEGNLFISDTGYHRIRRVDAATGMITIVAGTGAPGSSGDGRPAIIARLANPRGIAVDASGNLFIADTYNSRIRRVDAATGVITTIAGTGVQGFNGDRRPATSAHLSWPTDVAVDAAGNLFIADTSNDRVRRVDSATGMITTVAGTGVGGFNGDGQAATAARLSTPWSVTIDAAGNLFVADTSNHRVRRVDAATGLITTVAGTGVAGYNGDEQLAAAAQLWFPNGVAVDASGNLFVADASNNRVRRIDAVTGRIATVAGTEEFGYTGDDGPAVAARLAIPTDVTFDAEGNLYIADWYNAAIRAVRAP
jgi:sugar lactone lactonase YvrE